MVHLKEVLTRHAIARFDIETIIYPLFDDADMYIQERAIQLLGFHAYKPAVAKLRALATNAQHNGQLAAKIALQKIAASDA